MEGDSNSVANQKKLLQKYAKENDFSKAHQQGVLIGAPFFIP